MDKQLKVTLMLQAIDKVTSVVSKMTDNAAKGFTRLQKEADKVAKSAADIGKKAGVAGLAIAAPLILATKEAIKFEDKMADVGKVMNLEAGSAGLRAAGDEVKKLSVYLAQTPQDVAELYANIAQGGVAADQVGKVAKLAGEIGVAFGISAGEAGESFIKISNAMGTTIDETKKVMDALNHLGNNTASTSAELTEFLKSGGAGAARQLRLAGEEAASFGSLLISSGKSASEAGTIFDRMSKGIQKNAGMMATFKKAGGGVEGVMAIIEKGSKMNPEARFKYFKNFGEYGTDIGLMAQNLDKLKDTLGLVSDETKFADSANAEFLNRQQTMATQMAKVKTQVTILAITIGEKLMPIIAKVMDKVAPLIDKIADWIEKNPKLTEGIVLGAAALSALLLATSGVAFAISGISKAVSMFSGALKFLMANPIILWIAAIGAAVYLIYANWDKITAFFTKVWDGVKGIFTGVVNWFKNLGKMFYDAGANIINSIVDGITSKMDKVTEKVKGVAKKIRDFFPFSPAKAGPLMDIHRIKLMETVAGSIKPAPVLKAVQSVTQQVRGALPRATGLDTLGTSAFGGFGGIQASGNGGGAVTVNFSPNITLGAGANPSAKEDFMSMLRSFQPELVRMIEDAMRKNERKKY